jgi:hypothetical protein
MSLPVCLVEGSQIRHHDAVPQVKQTGRRLQQAPSGGRATARTLARQALGQPATAVNLH